MIIAEVLKSVVVVKDNLKTARTGYYLQNGKKKMKNSTRRNQFTHIYWRREFSLNSGWKTKY